MRRNWAIWQPASAGGLANLAGVRHGAASFSNFLMRVLQGEGRPAEGLCGLHRLTATAAHSPKTAWHPSNQSKQLANPSTRAHAHLSGQPVYTTSTLNSLPQRSQQRCPAGLRGTAAAAASSCGVTAEVHASTSKLRRRSLGRGLLSRACRAASAGQDTMHCHRSSNQMEAYAADSRGRWQMKLGALFRQPAHRVHLRSEKSLRSSGPRASTYWNSQPKPLQ